MWQIAIIILAIFILTYLYARWKFNFWFIQPVMHYYSFYYWICKSGIINNNLPKTNKFCNFINIETTLFPIEKELWNQIIPFIQQNYLQNGNNYFLPELNNIQPHFSHSPSFLSVYWKNVSYFDKNEVKQKKDIIGLMTTRPIHVEFLDNKTNIDVYYVDYLCVKKGKRKQGIAPQIIQTHEYQQRYSNQKIKVSLFKREEEITGIIPLCIYSNYLYHFVPIAKDIVEYDLIRANKNNLFLILDFFKLIKKT
jgi:hypothetical protein